MHLSLSNDVSSFMLIRSENLQGRSTMPLHPMEGQGSPPPTPNMAAAEGINSDILSERHSRCPFLCNLRRKFQISSHKSQMWDLQWLIPYMGPGEPPQPPLLSNMAAMGGIVAVKFSQSGMWGVDSNVNRGVDSEFQVGNRKLEVWNAITPTEGQEQPRTLFKTAAGGT